MQTWVAWGALNSQILGQGLSHFLIIVLYVEVTLLIQPFSELMSFTVLGECSSFKHL